MSMQPLPVAPQEERQGEKVPGVELVMDRARKGDADEIGGEKDLDNVRRRGARRVVVFALARLLLLAVDHLLPPRRGVGAAEEEGKHREVAREEQESELFAEENLLPEEAPVHGPDKEELARELKSFGNVAHGVVEEERRAGDELDGRAQGEAERYPRERVVLDQQVQQARCVEQPVHLDRDRTGKDEAAPDPVAARKEEHRQERERVLEAVVEQPQHEKGVDPPRGAEEKRGEPLREAQRGAVHRFPQLHAQPHCEREKDRENALREQDVLPAPSDSV